ncbi:MAG: RNA-binding protein [Cryomorphaceae bacterium]|nr:RNA-binding protein [Cryomorphaceae bacterium]
MKIYVASIPFRTSEDDLRSAFENYGDVSSVRIIKDRETQRSRGFGFVEMDNDSDAQSAIDGLNGSEFQGRELVVNEARPREEQPGRNRF